MSDLSIPGVTSKYDTQKLIEGLMKVERIPRDRAAERLEQIRFQRTAWSELGRRISSLRDSARSLYSFQNPFNERIANSSAPSVLVATATREAMEETKRIQVVQTAATDRFMSDRLAADARVPAGNYVFTVGSAAVRVNYPGGALADFAAAINRRGGDNLRAQVVNVTADSRVLVIEALKTGKDTRLGFEEAARDFGLSAGLVEEGLGSARKLDTASPSRFERALDQSRVSGSAQGLSVLAGGEAALRLASPAPSKGLVMEIELEISERPTAPAPAAPTGPSFPSAGGIEFEGIRIQSAPSTAPLPELAQEAPPPRVDNDRLLYLIDGSGRSVALPPVGGSGRQTVTVPLEVYADAVAGLGARNENTHKDLRILSARVFDPTETAGLRPKNPIETARDAVIKMDGIEVSRPTNKIDDLIPGVTLEPLRASAETVDLSIEPNRQAAKDAVIDLVGRYNRLMAEINILSRNDPAILNELEYLSESERESYEKRLGLFQGDSTLSSLRSNLQNAVINPYDSSDGPTILANLGISTNARTGGGYDATRLRGYLEIDEAKLDAALRQNFRQAKDLFGYDSDRDLIIDTGIAHRLDALTGGYVQTGGILAAKDSTLNGQIDRAQREIASLDQQLARKEADLKRKYGIMEGALGQMESMSGAWDNFNQQGSNR